MKENNFCHAIKCCYANKTHLKKKWKCCSNITGALESRCSYFTTSGTIDLSHMEYLREYTPSCYRTEFQIVAALAKAKYMKIKKEPDEN